MTSPQIVGAVRFGYGLSPAQKPAANAAQLLAQLKQPVGQAFPPEGAPARRQRIAAMDAEMAGLNHSGLSEPSKKEARQKHSMAARTLFLADSKRRLWQNINSESGFQERLVSFWVDHFSVSAAKNQRLLLWMPLMEAEAIRPNIAGSFFELLKAADTHPAMLIYLDQIASVGPNSMASLQKSERGLNENLAREMLELHSLGAGSGYVQQDVRAAAALLTGLTLDYRTANTVFRYGMAEPGPQTVLGHSYGAGQRSLGDIEALMRDLARDRRTAQHICRKLAIHFVSDTPTASLVEVMQAAWLQTDGNLSAVYAAMLAAPEAWVAPGAKVRQPLDYVVASLRLLGAPDDKQTAAAFLAPDDEGTAMAIRRINAFGRLKGDEQGRQDDVAVSVLALAALTRMGQPLWAPPSPAGFNEDAASWVVAAQLAERISWARQAVGCLAPRINARALLDGPVAELLSPAALKIIQQAPNTAAGLSLALASPDFNRR